MGSSSSFPTPFGSACLRGGPQGNATKGHLMCMKTVVTIAREISICVENQELPVQTGASPSVLLLELSLQAGDQLTQLLGQVFHLER